MYAVWGFLTPTAAGSTAREGAPQLGWCAQGRET